MEKKRQAARYVDFDDSELWRLIPEFSATTTSYNDFRTAVLRFYPGALDTTSHTHTDLDNIVSQQQCLDIDSIEDLAAYHRRFLSTSQHLIKHG